MHAQLKLTILPMWPSVRKLRQEIAATLEGAASELRSATMMTASELVENAIKYGESVAAAEAISFAMEASAGKICIRVSNGSTNAAAVGELACRIEEVSQATDKQALYLGRLQQMLERPGESGKLGIYRIGFEGRFDLCFDYSDEVVVVTATRSSDV